MSKERNISSEQILYLLINLREQEGSKDDFTEISVNKEKCREIGLFGYADKEKEETLGSRLFLISETRDGVDFDIIYNESGKVIAWVDYEKEKGGELNIAQDIALDKKRLERQLMLDRERSLEEENDGSADDTSKAGDGRDLASKEHEKEEPKKKENGKEKNPEEKKLQIAKKNLKDDINMDNRVRIRMDTLINGYYLWEILGIEDKLKGKMPEGVSERSFRNGYLTMIDSKELEEKDGKKREAENVLAICNSDGDIIELDEDVLEPEYLGTRDERMIQESNRIRYADGKEVEKPHTDMDLTRTSKWRIKDVNSRFAVNEEWYLGVDINREWKENGSRPIGGKLQEISFIQEPRQTGEVYSRDSAEARTRESIEYKLEDASEPPLTEKEQKQKDDLTRKDANEAENVRKEHQGELKEIVERLTKKYGESYRKKIEEQVEEEHKKGKDVEEIEKNVKKNMDDLENEYYMHGRSRNG